MSGCCPTPSARAQGCTSCSPTLTRHHHLARGGVEVATDGSNASAARRCGTRPGRWQQTRGRGTAGDAGLLWRSARSLGAGSVVEELMKKPSRGAALVSGGDRQRSDRPRQGLRPGADEFAAGPLRRRARAGLPGIQQSRQRAVLPAVRLRSHRRDHAARGRARPCGRCGGQPR